MSHSFPLKPLLVLTQTRMDDAARRLGELIASEQEGTRKLELLQNYRAEYEARFHDATRHGMSPETWRNPRSSARGNSPWPVRTHGGSIATR